MHSIFFAFLKIRILCIKFSWLLQKLEFAGFDFDIKSKFPSPSLRSSYIAHYLSVTLARQNEAPCESSVSVGVLWDDLQTVERDALVSAFDVLQIMISLIFIFHSCTSLSLHIFYYCTIQRVMLHYTLASHLFWGTWSLVQAGMSSIDFDFLGYSKLRYDGYAYHKDLFEIA